MRVQFSWAPLFFLWTLAGCSKYYLSLRQVPIDDQYLASSHVGSPDPRQANPPMGQKVVMQWAVPPELLSEKPRLVFHVIYKNHTQEEFVYPIKDRMGMEVFSLLNEHYRDKGGLLTYHAEIRTEDGAMYKEWKHQLWVHLITFEDESSSEALKTSDSVSFQFKQGSVTETP